MLPVLGGLGVLAGCGDDTGAGGSAGGGAGGSSGLNRADTTLSANVDTIDVRLAGRTGWTGASSPDPLRSSTMYMRHSSHAAQAFLGSPQHTTRGIDLNWAFEISECVLESECAKSFESYLVGTPGNETPLVTEIPAQSDDIVLFFTRTPAWLSSCSSKLGAAACAADSACGYIDTKVFQLYPPGDMAEWRKILRKTVEVALDLTEKDGIPHRVLIEAWNEPNVPTCSWGDTHDAFLEFYRQTSIEVSDAQTELCASKGLSAERCARLRFGGPAVGAWNGKIDTTRPTTLVEDLIDYTLTEARADPRVRLDFISFHGFFGSAPDPAAQLAQAKATFQSAYDEGAGSDAPFPMPEIVVSEWNADDGNRAAARHPAIMAETFYGLLREDLRAATIASLDHQNDAATLDDNDFGMLLSDAFTTNYRRPAYEVVELFNVLGEASAELGFAQSEGAHLVMRGPLEGATSSHECYSAILWDFAPDPLLAGVVALVDSCGVEALAASYGTAVPAGPLPDICAPFAAAPASTQALCRDLATGSCDSIPVPTPASGHACDEAWQANFADAKATLDGLVHALATPATVILHGALDTETNGELFVEDHEAPMGSTITFHPNADGLEFSMERNAVALLNTCVAAPGTD
ncbi:MAG: hypothetical protein U0271_36985 [Polyangiaceae bacterium]